jgi:hypothetical protein
MLPSVFASYFCRILSARQIVIYYRQTNQLKVVLTLMYQSQSYANHSLHS